MLAVTLKIYMRSIERSADGLRREKRSRQRENPLQMRAKTWTQRIRTQLERTPKRRLVFAAIVAIVVVVFSTVTAADVNFRSKHANRAHRTLHTVAHDWRQY